MDEKEFFKNRLLDLSAQADRKNYVTFSGFLNLNEQNIFHIVKNGLYTKTRLFGGYEGAERQMVAFIPDALSYAYAFGMPDADFPIRCLCVRPKNVKFAEVLTHRDLLGALMHLGIDRSKIGDLIVRDGVSYVFCETGIHSFILESLTQVKHTQVVSALTDCVELAEFEPDLEVITERIASNRIDCIVAKAYHVSRQETAELLAAQKVFVDGRCITNSSQPCESGAIVSVRGRGRFIFETSNALSKKGKLCVNFKMYR